ncbi:unnamed protein product [Spirodela intermedia]|uniref:SCP domain-containing protein n=2 Tax=Spirodela intermedia TaxID=51605 RepID=A0A7I8K7U3_SPIIN|nr:unnamed protein product [Spirodela intermedia]
MGHGRNGAAWAILIGLSTVLLCRAQNYPVDYLDAHNAARAEVGVQPLQWDDFLAAYAFGYALVRSADCELIHSRGPHGENIYEGYGNGASSGTDAVRWWYNEKPYYDYAANDCTGGVDCLHYTQMVWRNSVRVGCARVRCGNGSFFVTCNYDPPGNVGGKRPY